MDAPSMTTSDFAELGAIVAKYARSNSEKVAMRRFKSEFGVAPDVVRDAWDLLIESKFFQRKISKATILRRPPNPQHLLWALMLLKQYSLTTTLAKIAKVDEKTYRKWSFLYLDSLAELDRVVVGT